MGDPITDLASERQNRFTNTLGFLKTAETKYPGLASQLPVLLSGMLGDQAFSPDLMVKNEGFIVGGLAALGEWLGQIGFYGFRMSNLGIKDTGIKVAAKGLLNGEVSSRNAFFANSGVDQQNWSQLHEAMVDLSKTVGGMLEIGYSPRQIIGTLFVQSTAAIGAEQAQTSIPTRDMLIKASGGRLAEVNQILNRWVRGQ